MGHCSRKLFIGSLKIILLTHSDVTSTKRLQGAWEMLRWRLLPCDFDRCGNMVKGDFDHLLIGMSEPISHSEFLFYIRTQRRNPPVLVSRFLFIAYRRFSFRILILIGRIGNKSMDQRS